MAWKFNPASWVNGTTIPTVTDYQNIASDIQVLGGSQDGGGYGLANSAFLSLVPGELPGTTHTVSGGSWAAGVATLAIGVHAISVNQRVRITGVTPSGYNSVTDTVVTAVASGLISYALITNPGAWVSGGSVLVGTVSPARGMIAVDQFFNPKVYTGSAWIVVGGQGVAVLTKTASYTILATDGIDVLVLANAASGALTITLPNSVGANGNTVTVKKTDSSTNGVTIATSSGQFLDNASSIVIGRRYDAISIASDNANWWMF